MLFKHGGGDSGHFHTDFGVEIRKELEIRSIDDSGSESIKRQQIGIEVIRQCLELDDFVQVPKHLSVGGQPSETAVRRRQTAHKLIFVSI